MLQRIFFLALGFLLLSPITASAEDWGQWLGPNRDGKSAEKGLVSGWAKGGEPAVRWKIPLGSGFSGVAVVGDRVYTMTSDPVPDDEDEITSKHREYLVALSARDGKEIWKKAIGPVFVDRMGGNGPRATPTVYKGQVFALSGHGILMAFKADTGSVRWMTDLKQAFGAETPKWGFCASPLVVNDTLYIDAGGSLGHGLVALNIHDGTVRWNNGDFKTGYSSAILAKAAGVPQVVFFPADYVVGIAPDSGKVLWKESWETRYDVNAATPLFIAPDKVFISTAYGTGAGLFQISKTPAGLKSKTLWKAKTMKNKMATSIVHEDHIYGFSEEDLTCIRASDGKTVWSEEGFGHGTLIFADGKLLVLGDEGKFAMVEASPKGFNKMGSMQALNETCWTVPSLSEGIVYLRDIQHLMAVDLKKKAKE